jgi:hypothetical protein
MGDITRVPLSNSPWLGVRIAAIIAIVFCAVAYVYDLGVKQGQIGALKTAYEVCRKVAPYKDGEGCK